MSIHLMRYEELKVFCEAAYQGFGFSLSQSELITDVYYWRICMGSIRMEQTGS